jgi:hypothetical protein
VASTFAVNTDDGAGALEAIMAASVGTFKLVLGAMVGTTADEVDNNICPMLAAVHLMAKLPAVRALLYERFRDSQLGAD